jgi:hypothetical protein
MLNFVKGARIVFMSLINSQKNVAERRADVVYFIYIYIQRIRKNTETVAV